MNIMFVGNNIPRPFVPLLPESFSTSVYPQNLGLGGEAEKEQNEQEKYKRKIRNKRINRRIKKNMCMER